MHRFILGLSVGLSSLAAASLNAVAAEGFADLAEKLTPSVVNIAALHNPGGASGSSSMPLDQFLHQFFGDHGDNEENGDSGPAEPPTPPGSPDASGPSVGSGFIIDASGYIVTNNHVIDGGDQIMVTLQDDTTLEASVVGRDTVTDIALLKVNAGKKLPVAVWGDANKSRPGDWVLVIGDPFGLGGTVTAGILSARAREINAGPYDDFLQTDAAINRGNSGGPLFNMAGEVIGINTAIYSPSGGSIGIGFAISSNLARPIIEQLKAHGKVERGWLGVRIQPMSVEIAESLGLEKPMGALIADIDADGPAAATEMRAGDVILKFDGKQVERGRQLPRMVADAAIGKEVSVTIWRDGKEVELKVKIAALDPQRLVVNRSADPKLPPAPTVDVLGLSLAMPTPSLRAHFSIDEGASGAVVMAVVANSPAAHSGVAPGDMVTAVGREIVATPEQVIEKIAQARQNQRKSVLLRVERKGSGHFIALPIEQG